VSIWLAAGLALLFAIVGFRVWLYWHSLGTPNVGSAIAILLGAVVGTFTAKFVSSLFGSEFGRRDPIVGAGVLALLCIIYSLPLYSDAVSDMLNGIGLSTVNISGLVARKM
jgi:hypothetical protein